MHLNRHGTHIFSKANTWENSLLVRCPSDYFIDMADYSLMRKHIQIYTPRANGYYWYAWSHEQEQKYASGLIPHYQGRSNSRKNDYNSHAHEEPTKPREAARSFIQLTEAVKVAEIWYA